MAEPHRRLTDPQWLLRYAVNHPKRAILYGIIALAVVAIVTASLAIQAIPIWVGALVAGLALVAIAREPLQRARLVWAATDQPTGSVDDGAVTVSGQVSAAADRRLTSELGEVDCLAYEYGRTTTHHESGAGTTENTSTRQAVLPFYVDDGSGRVLVDATTGTLSLHADETTTSGSVDHEEAIIQEGDDVTVYGEARQPSGNRDLPDEVDRVVTTGSEYGDILVTDNHHTRVLARQGAYAVGWIFIGGGLVITALGMALGVLSV